MILHMGKGKAKMFGDLHEEGEPDPVDVAFGQYNNAVGRSVGEQFRNRIADFDAAELGIANMCQKLTLNNNGNQTSRGTDTYTWSHENELKQAAIGGVTTNYVYNGDGCVSPRT